MRVDHVQVSEERVVGMAALEEMAPHSQRAGTSIDTPVSLIDVAPTIAELAGAADPRARFDGASLRRAGDGAQRPIFAETRVDAINLKAARLGTLKCIENIGGVDRFSRPAPVLQAFDLASDPGERSPLTPSDGRFERCRRLLRRSLSAGVHGEASPQGTLSPAEQAKLRALGYIR
jgi:hypothetical protein